MKHLRLQQVKTLNDGQGLVSYTTKDNLIVLSTNKILEDAQDRKVKRKIGVSLCSGCGIGCIYCFTNQLKHFRPLSVSEIIEQVKMILEQSENKRIFDEVKVSFKQMGDPLLNSNVAEAIQLLHQQYPDFNFVVSTSGPKINQHLFGDLQNLGVNIRLQFSCHTTSDKERRFLSPNISMMTLEEISQVVNSWNDGLVTLNFVMLKGFEYSADKLRQIFNPDQIFIKVNYLDDNSQLKKHGLSDMPEEKILNFTQALQRDGFQYAFRNAS
ncbi:radical SAM protein [Patescibacteria group bacterium]